jgi:hypothetical protein
MQTTHRSPSKRAQRVSHFAHVWVSLALIAVMPLAHAINGSQHFTVGISWNATNRLTLGFDFQRIYFGSIGAIDPARCFGGKDGSGFGGNNQSVHKFGAI